MSASQPVHSPDERRLDEFHALPLSVKVRALSDLATDLRGYADRWEAENRLRCVDDDLVDAVAECLYSISSQRMGRLAPGRSTWTQLPDKSSTRSEYRAIARSMLEHFDIKPRFRCHGIRPQQEHPESNPSRDASRRGPTDQFDEPL